MMEISNKAIEALEHFEGFSHKPYKCPAGVWTIGFGSTRIGRNKVTKDTPLITRADALKVKKDYFKNSVYPYLKGLKLNQNQFDALCLVIYNIGAKAYSGSSIERVLMANNNILWSKTQLKKLADAWILWRKVKGKDYNGLIRRRRWEFLYFLNGTNSYYVSEPEVYDEYLKRCGKDIYQRIDSSKYIDSV